MVQTWKSGCWDEAKGEFTLVYSCSWGQANQHLDKGERNRGNAVMRKDRKALTSFHSEGAQEECDHSQELVSGTASVLTIPQLSE